MRSLNSRRVDACACRATNTPEPARIQVEGCNALILKAVFFAHTSGSAFFSGVAIVVVVVVGFFLPLHFFRVSLSASDYITMELLASTPPLRTQPHDKLR